jgi:hypothetical protein
LTRDSESPDSPTSQMAKRKPRANAALQSELAEYTSLLRALRTADTLDITTQLTRHSQQHAPEVSRDPKQRRHRTTGLGDRWPLLPEDVHIPEWGFEDEVRALASQASRGEGDDDDDDDDDDDADILPGLYEETFAHLSAILDHIAVHVPPTAKSLQDRFRPIGWEDVLQIVSASGAVDERSVLRYDTARLLILSVGR